MSILRAIKELFFIQSAWLSGFVALGFLASHLLHIHVYQSRNGQTLQTWFSRFGLGDPIPMVMGAKLSIIFAVVIFLVFQLLFSIAADVPNIAVLKWGLVATGALVALSQVPFSSVMRMPYEVSFCTIALGSLLLQKAFAASSTNSLAQHQALWDLLKFVIPLCIGLPVVMGGVGLIASFYSSETGVLRLQLYRHVYMAGYFLVGAVIFLIYPIARQLLLSNPDF